MEKKKKIPKKYKKVRTYKSPLLKDKEKKEKLAKTQAKIKKVNKRIKKAKGKK
jgi:hypothetical protein